MLSYKISIWTQVLMNGWQRHYQLNHLLSSRGSSIEEWWWSFPLTPNIYTHVKTWSVFFWRQNCNPVVEKLLTSHMVMISILELLKVYFSQKYKFHFKTLTVNHYHFSIWKCNYFLHFLDINAHVCFSLNHTITFSLSICLQ